MRKLIGIAVLAPVLLAGAPTDARADDTYCPPDLVQVNVDDVIVDGDCSMLRTRVAGDVNVEPGGRLKARGVNIRGDLLTDRAAAVSFLTEERHYGRPLTVNGNVKVKGTAAGGSVVFCNLVIVGDLQLVKNASPIQVGSGKHCGDQGDVAVGGDLRAVKNTGEFELGRSHIGGDVEVFRNTGGTLLHGNNILGDLQCENNDPAADAFENFVAGDAEGECADF